MCVPYLRHQSQLADVPRQMRRQLRSCVAATHRHADISPLLANGYPWDKTKAADEVAAAPIQKSSGDPCKGEG